jgi:hypothetical protein
VSVVAAISVDLSSFHLSLLSSSFYLWHSHLGYVLSSCLRFLASIWALKNLQTYDISYCSECKLANFSALPFNQSISVSSSSCDFIHSDVLGLSYVTIKRGSRYYVFFIDDHTCYSGRVLLVVFWCIRSRLILIDLLSDTKLGWLQKNSQ